MGNENARYVGQSSRPISTAKPRDVHSVGISSVRKVCTEPVYNMEVDGTHCFAANGLIIHNCMDAMRYFCNTVAKDMIRGYM